MSTTSDDDLTHLMQAGLEHFIQKFLPIFTRGMNGDATLAKAAILHAFSSFEISSFFDLMQAAQIIALNMASLDSALQSLDGDLSLAMRQKLRAGAASAARSARQLVARIPPRQADAEIAAIMPDADAAPPPEPMPQPVVRPATTAQRPDRTPESASAYYSAWGQAALDVAEEFAQDAEKPDLTEAERTIAAIRADTLRRSAERMLDSVRRTGRPEPP